jgi:hypothetical protein
MARDLSFLLSALEPSAEPEIDALDSRLLAVTDLASKRRYEEAARSAEQLFAERIYDVRATSVYLYQAFAEDGFCALSTVFSAIDAMLGHNFNAISPAKRREEHFDRRFSWLFATLVDTLTYHHKKSTNEWETWTKGQTEASIEDLITTARALGEHFAKGPFAASQNALGRLTTWLEGYGELLSKAAVAITAEANAKARREQPKPTDASKVEHFEPMRQHVELAVSHQFLELCNKLKAFETLVERGQFQKAALVGNDIMTLLDHFDPRSYFPELFSRFSALMSQHITHLAGHWTDRESVGWNALSQFYRVDLKAFVGDE